MSKIALTPNASGTGTFTIASPNSNTDRTLTLPDAAGAVVIDEAGGGSVKIDSSGNVGIGTSSPAEELDVNGTIKATNVSDGTLSIPATYVTNGSAKAWVNFNGTGTIAERDSLNLSGLTDNGTGDYTVSFTNAFDAADYAACPSVASGGVNSGTSAAFVNAQASMATGSIRLGLTDFTSGGDRDYVGVTIHGDLA